MSQLRAERAQRIHENSPALAQASEPAGYGIHRRSFSICFRNATKGVYNFRGTRLSLHRGNEKARDAAIVILIRPVHHCNIDSSSRTRREPWPALWKVLPSRTCGRTERQ
jgi:hypothetical protein